MSQDRGGVWTSAHAHARHASTAPSRTTSTRARARHAAVHASSAQDIRNLEHPVSIDSIVTPWSRASTSKYTPNLAGCMQTRAARQRVRTARYARAAAPAAAEPGARPQRHQKRRTHASNAVERRDLHFPTRRHRSRPPPHLRRRVHVPAAVAAARAGLAGGGRVGSGRACSPGVRGPRLCDERLSPVCGLHRRGRHGHGVQSLPPRRGRPR